MHERLRKIYKDVGLLIPGEVSMIWRMEEDSKLCKKKESYLRDRMK